MLKEQAVERDRRGDFARHFRASSIRRLKSTFTWLVSETVNTAFSHFGEAQSVSDTTRLLPAKATPPIICTWSSAASFGVVGPIGTVAAASSLFTCPESFLDGARTCPFTSLEAATNTLVFFPNAALCMPPPLRRQNCNVSVGRHHNELRRVQEHSLLLSKQAMPRGNILIDLSMRLGTTSHLDLPMSHQDIADYSCFRSSSELDHTYALRNLIYCAVIGSNIGSAKPCIAGTDSKLVGHFILRRQTDAALSRPAFN